MNLLPVQLFRREIPQGQSPIGCTSDQVGRVRRERTDPHRAATGTLHDGLGLSCDHGSDNRGSVGGAGAEELSAGLKQQRWSWSHVPTALRSHWCCRS